MKEINNIIPRNNKNKLNVFSGMAKCVKNHSWHGCHESYYFQFAVHYNYMLLAKLMTAKHWKQFPILILIISFLARRALTIVLGWRNSIMVSVSICQASSPGSSPTWPFCFRKVELCQNICTIGLSHLCRWLVEGHTMCYHVYLIMHIKDLLLFPHVGYTRNCD